MNFKKFWGVHVYIGTYRTRTSLVYFITQVIVEIDVIEKKLIHRSWRAPLLALLCLIVEFERDEYM